MSEQKKLNKDNAFTVVTHGAVVVCMFAFAMWVMPPLYTLFCEITGLNGKTGGPYVAVDAGIDTSRKVKVQFVGIKNDKMPWGFKPEDFSVTVHPGEAVQTNFIASNPTKKYMVGQAVPSVAPLSAAEYFHKTECFCFEQQHLKAGERAALGLQFIVDKELPKGVRTITLSYTLFDVTEKFPQLEAQSVHDIDATDT